MTAILYLTCSPKGSVSVCRTFADEVLDRLRAHHPAARIVHRDLAASPPRFVDEAFCAAIMDPAGNHGEAFAESEPLIEELEAADILLIATPMNNYTVPAVL